MFSKHDGKTTILEMLPILLQDMESEENQALLERNPKEFQQKFDSDPQWEALKIATPRLWLKATRGELRSNDPHLLEMYNQLHAVRDGRRSLKQAYKSVDKQMTEEYVYSQVGRPDAHGRIVGEK